MEQGLEKYEGHGPELLAVSPRGAVVLGSFLAQYRAGASRETVAGCLRQCADILGAPHPSQFDWRRLDFTVASIFASLWREQSAPATAAKKVSILRAWSAHLWKSGLIDTDTNARIAAIRVKVPRRAHGTRGVSYGDVVRLFSLCAEDPDGARDYVALSLLYGYGLRRDEAATLRWEHVEERGLRIFGKGGHERFVGHPANAERWMELSRSNRRTDRETVLWSVHEPARGVTAKAIYHLVIKRANRVNLTLRPHDLRRAYVSHLLQAAVDISVASRLVGHASVTTTQRYDQRGHEATLTAAKQLTIP